MSLDAVVQALHLPPACTPKPHRVPKREVTAQLPRALGRRFDDGTERLRWMATLKPATVGLSAGTLTTGAGETVPVPELLVLTLEARERADVGAVAEAVHRAVHMHMLLVVEHQGHVHLSVASKRTSQADPSKSVLVEAPVASPPLPTALDQPHHAALLHALSVDHRHEPDLGTLYDRWRAALLGAQVAAVTGQFSLVTVPTQLADRVHHLAEVHRLSAELATMARALRGASLLRDRVRLAEQLKHTEHLLATHKAQLLATTTPRVP